ncbi:hypothetical protein EFN63_05915 [Leuconostoc citreum]|mgnify:CR=1 FL=1|uniref:hypothetical protein n=1 Tax=Leuconostoc citreum TaxID=33964 RepID=UPI001058FFE3|nr:hypothetical protein [Leuconostoc citreum]MCT3067903.1 hypothetical protein [Leuconostoc citreum]TDG64897.1 hypothetical protein C5L21_001236 [Leuconostoc citreum]TOY70094.1 hypothetical protein DIS12_01095 [Leuconostoc citreum]
MKKYVLTIGNSALSIISSTVIVLPFMFFLRISATHTVSSVLPFVIFYTLRTTGIFLIRGIKTSLNSASLLKISLYSGTLGSIFGIIGSFFPELYIISGFFLGLSAAWLPTANTSINFLNIKNNLLLAKNKYFTILTLILIGYILFIPSKTSFIIFFLFYTVLYLIAIITLPTLNQYAVDSHDLESYSYQYLGLFVVFFVLIFSLRSSRLMKNIMQFDYFIWGSLLLAIVLIVSKLFFNRAPQRNVPNLLSYISIINGALGNYLFLFASLYVAGYYGHHDLFTRFYIPYIIGIVTAPIINKVLVKKNNHTIFIMLFIGLLIMFFRPLFPWGILSLSITKGCLNLKLNHIYMTQDNLPSDKRIWVKNTIQSTGSIIYQFIIMITGSLIVSDNNHSIKELLDITSQGIPSNYSRALMIEWNLVTTTILLIMIMFYYFFYLLTYIKINR